MNLVRLLSVLATTSPVLATFFAEDTPAPTTATPTEPPPGNVEPLKHPATIPAAPTPTPALVTPGTSKLALAGSKPSSPNESPLNELKQMILGCEYQMPMFGKGDFEHSYVAAMDTVNMASVEGALMYVQAEGIDVLARSEELCCERKNKMKWVVLYEILIAQSNETIAQYRDKWNVPEYGQMQPMDSGRCTPIKGETFPPECLQFNGEDKQLILGPFIDGGLKDDNDKAPYPDTYWFSFPTTCPLQVFGKKEDLDMECRKNSRKGLCDLGKAPGGVECTFTYDILGWVPLDDIVGITNLEDDDGNEYKDFEQWCKASKDHNEFKHGPKNGMLEGLDFWKDSLDPNANAKRAEKANNMYEDIVAGAFVSTLIDGDSVTKLKPLSKPDQHESSNSPCYKTAPKSNEGFGCQRRGFLQIYFPCKSAEACCTTDPNFKFPALATAPTSLSDEETSSVPDPELGANGRTDGTKNTKPPSSSANAVVGLPLVVLAVAAASLFTA